MQDQNLPTPAAASNHPFLGKLDVRRELRPSPTPGWPRPLPGLPPADYVLRIVCRPPERHLVYGCLIETALAAFVCGEA